MGRSYKEKDIKILWGAHSICAHPDCNEKLIRPATASDPEAVIGKICHIVAHSDKGPRADKSFPESQREHPDNLILLCGTHHDMIDVQPNSFTIDDLKKWKRDHEEWVEATLSDAVMALTFDELDKIATNLMSRPMSVEPSIAPPTPPTRKMRHNELTSAIAEYYQIGQLRFGDIEAYIADAHDWDDEFSERLIAGFADQFKVLWDRGYRGDDLYTGLAEWASGGRLASFPRTAAGVAILSYLFSTCDVFDREPMDAAPE